MKTLSRNLFRPQEKKLEESLIVALIPRSALISKEHFATDEYPLHIEAGVRSFADTAPKIYGKTRSETYSEHGKKDHILQMKLGRLVYTAFDTHSIHHQESGFTSDELVANCKIEEEKIQMEKVARLLQALEPTHVLELLSSSQLGPSIFYHSSNNSSRARGFQALELIKYFPQEVAQLDSGNYTLVPFKK